MNPALPQAKCIVLRQQDDHYHITDQMLDEFTVVNNNTENICSIPQMRTKEIKQVNLLHGIFFNLLQPYLLNVYNSCNVTFHASSKQF
jgi:hypothetical protein